MFNDGFIWQLIRSGKIEWLKIVGRVLTVGGQSITVLIRDAAGDVLLGTCTTIPSDTGSGFAKGCVLIDTDVVTGTSGVYENIGTKTSCRFVLIGAQASLSDYWAKADVGGVIAVEDAATMSREDNVAGLSSAITLANEIRGDIISHFANATRHTTGQQSTSGIADACDDLASLLSLAGELLTLYAAHNADMILGSGWAYHNEQGADKALSSAVTPTTLQEAVTRLNDLKTKYNDHEDETTGHASQASVVADQVAASSAAYGAANKIAVTGALTGDLISWSILNDGTGNVTGVSAVASAGYVTFTFSADPQNDTIISYAVVRPAS